VAYKITDGQQFCAENRNWTALRKLTTFSVCPFNTNNIRTDNDCQEYFFLDTHCETLEMSHYSTLALFSYCKLELWTMIITKKRDLNLNAEYLGKLKVHYVQKLWTYIHTHCSPIALPGSLKESSYHSSHFSSPHLALSELNSFHLTWVSLIGRSHSELGRFIP